MKLAARKQSKAAASAREQLAFAHQVAPSMSKVFPRIDALHIDLAFQDLSSALPPPSRQLRSLYAAAPAFFRFPCPCADCDGIFDLTEEVTALIAKGTTRNPVLTLEGTRTCEGNRFPDHAELHARCEMKLTFQLRAQMSVETGDRG